MPTSSSPSLVIVSKCRVYPEDKSAINPCLKLSVSDLPMLSCQYIQKGVLLTRPPHHIHSLLSLLRCSLSRTLSIFPPLAGRLFTDAAGHVRILCSGDGVDFVVAKASCLCVRDVLAEDVPDAVRLLFAFDNTLSYSGHSNPLAAVQVTELSDGGVFIGCTVNHSLVDGTSFWHFFNTFAAVTKGGEAIALKNPPSFDRDTVFDSPAVLRLPSGGPKATFSGDEPLRERIFQFSRDSILKLKSRANNYKSLQVNHRQITEISGKQSNDRFVTVNGDYEKIMTTKERVINGVRNRTDEISSFQSLCAQLWRSVTRARKLEPSKTTTFRMAVNCRHRLEPKLDPYYFGNAIQSIPTTAEAGELLSKDLRWSAAKLHENVAAHGDSTVRRGVEEWEREPRLFPLGNFDGAMITMGSSPRFPMYDNDFGWGRPVAVRSGRANKFDGKISAFPGREGGGNVDLEVVLSPATMAGLETDSEFMDYVSGIV